MQSSRNQIIQLRYTWRLAFLLSMACLVLLLFSAQNVSSACKDSPSNGLDWTDCRKRNLILAGKDLSASKFTNTDLTSTNFSGSKLDSANFTKANITRANLSSVTAKNANFEKVVGNRTNMSSIVLTNSSFEKAEIPRTDFSNAQMINTSFTRAEIGRSNFSGARLENIDFSFANLARADFRNSINSGGLNFKGAYLFQTRFDGLDMTNFTGISQWQIEMACGNVDTILPSGLEKPNHWPCPEEED